MPTILIVEHDTGFLRVLQYQLTAASYETTAAENGKGELELFSEGRYQAVVTDLNISGIDGEEI